MAQVRLYVPEYMARRLRAELADVNWSCLFQLQVERALSGDVPPEAVAERPHL